MGGDLHNLRRPMYKSALEGSFLSRDDDLGVLRISNKMFCVLWSFIYFSLAFPSRVILFCFAAILFLRGFCSPSSRFSFWFDFGAL